MNNLYVESYGQKFVAWGVFYGSIACMRYFLDNVVAESLKLVLLRPNSITRTSPRLPRDVRDFPETSPRQVGDKS